MVGQGGGYCTLSAQPLRTKARRAFVPFREDGAVKG